MAGFGYWSGRDVTVELRPASPGSGIVFVRGDLTPPLRIRADVQQRIEVPRRTTLAADGAQVEMVEHVLAALYGLAIDNCEVWVNAPEMPGLDGSCQPLVEAIAAAGIVEQKAPSPPTDRDRCHARRRRRMLGRGSPGQIGRPAHQIQARLRPQQPDRPPDDRTGGDAQIFQRNSPPPAPSSWKTKPSGSASRGLGTRVTNQDLLVFGPDGPIDNPLRFENECVRHKALDLVGDLALAGCDLVGQFIAHKSGHRLNAELVRILLCEGQMEEGLRRSA